MHKGLHGDVHAVHLLRRKEGEEGKRKRRLLLLLPCPKAAWAGQPNVSSQLMEKNIVNHVNFKMNNVEESKIWSLRGIHSHSRYIAVFTRYV